MELKSRILDYNQNLQNNFGIISFMNAHWFRPDVRDITEPMLGLIYSRRWAYHIYRK